MHSWSDQYNTIHLFQPGSRLPPTNRLTSFSFNLIPQSCIKIHPKHLSPQNALQPTNSPASPPQTTALLRLSHPLTPLPAPHILTFTWPSHFPSRAINHDKRPHPPERNMALSWSRKRADPPNHPPNLEKFHHPSALGLDPILHLQLNSPAARKLDLHVLDGRFSNHLHCFALPSTS